MFRREECRISPITEADLRLVLSWRNSERIRENMYTDHVITWEEHRAWFDRIAGQTPARFLVFQHAGRALGVMQFSEPHPATRVSHWGFYIGVEDAPRGSGTVMALLALDYAFGTLGVSAVVGEAFRFNEGSVAYHRKLGFKEQQDLLRRVAKGGRDEEVLSFLLTREGWLEKKPLLEETCFGNGGA